MEILGPCNEIGSLTDALAAVDARVDALGAADVEAVSGGDLGGALVAIDRAIARLEAQRGRLLRVFDQRRAFGDEATSAVAWLRNACHMTGAAAAARVAVARRLPELAGAQRAFEDGDISFQHAASITRVLDDVGADVARQQEEVLVHTATTFDSSVVRSIGRRLLEEVDPHGADAEANKLHDERWLHVSPSLDGAVYIDGRLDPEGGAIVMSALDSLMAPHPGDERHVWQRRADALVELARRQLDNGDLPERGGLRPHVSLTVSIDKLHGDAGAAPAELGWIGSISTETARRITCDALVTTVVVDRKGNALVVAPEARVVPRRLRRALVIRDGECAGCGAPPSWCDAHHIRHRADGGKTAMANLVLLCRSCHTDVHEYGRTIQRADDGRFRIADARGRPRGERPRRPPPISCAA